MSIQTRIDETLAVVRNGLERAELPVDVVANRLLLLQSTAYDWNAQDIERQAAKLASPAEGG